MRIIWADTPRFPNLFFAPCKFKKHVLKNQSKQLQHIAAIVNVHMYDISEIVIVLFCVFCMSSSN